MGCVSRTAEAFIDARSTALLTSVNPYTCTTLIPKLSKLAIKLDVGALPATIVLTPCVTLLASGALTSEICTVGAAQ